MKIKLYSKAHLKEADQLFPLKTMDRSWLEQQWTDEEINACKALEMEAFIKVPSLQSCPRPELFAADLGMTEEASIVDKYLSNHPQVRNFLSIGCGFGNTELALAKRYSQIHFTVIDNAPHVEGINSVAKDLGVRNIFFRHHDLRQGPMGKFDVVFSMAVIYCIADEHLGAYFGTLADSVNKQGVIFVGCSANLCKLNMLKNIIKKAIGHKKVNNIENGRYLKQTGWLRNVAHIKRRIPNRLKVAQIYHIYHFHSTMREPLWMKKISHRVYPFLNIGYMFKLHLS